MEVYVQRLSACIDGSRATSSRSRQCGSLGSGGRRCVKMGKRILILKDFLFNLIYALYDTFSELNGAL